MRRNKISLPRFNLHEANSTEPTTIFLIYRYKRNSDDRLVRLKYSTGKKILPKAWDNGRALESLKYPLNTELNIFLDQLKAEAIRIVKDNPFISIDEFKRQLDVFNGYRAGQKDEIPTLDEYFGTYIGKKDWNTRTIKKFKGIQNKLEKFASDTGMVLKFDNLTKEWIKAFTTWLRTNGHKSKNTISKTFQIIKQVMEEAEQQTIIIGSKPVPYHTNKIYKDFEIGTTKTTKHYLTISELDKLWSLDLSNDPSKEIVRDYFLIMCYTGLRISDTMRLNKSNFFQDEEGYEFIRMHTFKGRTTKADNEVVIPVLPELKAIMDKYDYNLPKPLSEQKHNVYIKDIVKLAGINRVELHKSGDKEGTSTQVAISDHITNHSGRYTFIDLMLNHHGISPLELTKITGQSLKVLMGYEQGNKTKNAKKVFNKIHPKMEVVKNG